MSLLPTGRGFPGFSRFFDEMNREMAGFRPPYWLHSNDSLAVGADSTEVINNKDKFSIGLDVSHFKPEELKVKLEGHVITVEGHHELKDQHSYMQRSFCRKWTLPDDVDLEAVRTKLDENGHLAVTAPKIGQAAIGPRSIPIEHHK